MNPFDSVLSYLVDNAGVFLLVTGIVSTVSCVLVIVLLLRLRALTQPFHRLQKEEGGVTDCIPALVKAVEENKRALGKVASDIEALNGEGRMHLQRLGLVRYDAFDGVGGKQSYSLCLLDGEQNGFLLSFLTGKNSARGYAVRIDAGVPSRELGDEEKQAFDEALRSREAGVG